LYVANALCETTDVLAIVQETGSEWNMRKLVRTLRPDNFFRKSWRWLRDRRRYYGNPEAGYFFADGIPKLDQPELVKEVPYINHPDVVQLANKLKPDLIAVFGTSLIRGELLQKGRLGIVNLHGGLSPAYRGADCTFWALYNKEPENVGCTLHFIDAGIDTGRLIAHISPEVRPDDDELTLFWRSVKESGSVYAELMQRLACGEELGAPQHGRGFLYQVKQRGLRHERKVERMLAEGLLHDRELGLRVRWFQTESS
jgi:methionyl-tRNA formyltransferase